MKKLHWLLLILVLAALAMVAYQWKTVASLRSEQQALAAASDRSSGNGAPAFDADTLSVPEPELARLRAETKALARTRNEVRQLRQEKVELEKLRAENQQMAAAPAAPTNSLAEYVLASSLHDAGLATPEAACQTFFFALCQGDINRALDCGVADMDVRKEMARSSPEELSQHSQKMREQFKQFPGYRIQAKNVQSDDEVELTVRSIPGGTLMALPFHRYGGEWKLTRFMYPVAGRAASSGRLSN